MPTPVAVCLGVVGVLAAVAQRPLMVPSDLLSQVKRAPLEFAVFLANASVPTGIEIKEGDDAYPRRPPIARKESQAIEQIPVIDLVMAFNAQQRDYSAAVIGDVFVIRPTSGRAAFLDSASRIVPRVAVVGVIEAERTILSPLSPGLLTPMIGAGSGSEALKGLTTEFVLDGSDGRTVLDTLNQIVLRLPGAWQATTRERQGRSEIVKFGFIYSDSAHTVLPVPQD